MELPDRSPSPWPARRRRAEELRERHPFAAEVLALYLALLDVQEPAYEAALAHAPEPSRLPRFLARELLPPVVAATVSAGLEDVVSRWLQGREQPEVDRYLARAASAPVLEALEGDALSAACARGRRSDRDESWTARCPHCGGPPQVSFLPVSGESLVSAPRRLICARCAGSWIHTRMICPGCGEATGSRLPLYSDRERFPHLRIEGCVTCHRYLVAVDARHDAAAVPEVDELVALPLDLYAKERGLRKVTPNLMGI
jgi:FdhE protein